MAEYNPIITKQTIILDLKKPLYQSFFAIWKKWLDIAKVRHLNIVVNSPFGKCTYTYETWMKGAKRMKRFYKNPNEPMIFYGRSLLPDIKARDERKKQEADNQFIKEEMTSQGASKLLQAWKEALKRKSVITT